MDDWKNEYFGLHISLWFHGVKKELESRLHTWRQSSIHDLAVLAEDVFSL